MAGADLFATSEPPSLEGVESEGRVELMVEWFGENFDDPAQETPYESAEGGYIYIWGGPYDAREEIESAFPDATEEEIEAAVDEIQSDGLFDWAPSGNRIREVPDAFYDVDGPDGGLEEDVPLEERLIRLAGQLERIERHISYWRSQPPGIGHNGAPGAFSLEYDDEALLLAEQSVAEVRAELAKPNPEKNADEAVIVRAEGRFRSLLSKIKAVALASGVFVVSAVIEGVASAAGEDIYKDPQAFITTLSGAITNLAHWASNIPLPL